MTDYIGKGNYFGDRPMPISGRHTDERERLTSMTMEERAWRAKYCKDQELAPDEPKFVPQLEEHFINPIQRLYKKPLDFIFYRGLQPLIGQHGAYILRHAIPKGVMIYLAVAYAWYIMKYRESDWERFKGWKHRWAKPTYYPGDPGYPHRPEMKPQDFFSKGFNERKVFLDLDIHGTSTWSN